MRLWNQTRVMAIEAGKEGPCRSWQTGLNEDNDAARLLADDGEGKARHKRTTIGLKQKKRDEEKARRNGASEASDSWVLRFDS
jgi:hypothetical protein